MDSALLTLAVTTRSGLVDVLLLVAYALVLVAIVTIVHERRSARRAVVAGPPRDVARAATVEAPVRPKRPPRARAPETRLSPVPQRSAAPPTRPAPVPTGKGVAPSEEQAARETKPSPAETATSSTRRSTLPWGRGEQAASRVETCEIVWWRGLVKSQFYAALANGDGGSTAIVTSPLFRLVRGERPEPADDALAAHQTLVTLLQTEGWEPAGKGDAWYALRFQRVKAAPEAEPERDADTRPSVAAEPRAAQSAPEPAQETRPSAVAEPAVGEARPSPPAVQRAAVMRASPAAVTRPAPVSERAAAATRSASSVPEMKTWASAARTKPDTAPDVDVERCEIEWWRGFVKSQFYAGRPGGDGLPVAIELSPLFRWRGDGPPSETDEALAAHRTLVENLRADGWEPEPAPRAGGPWYAVGFRRERP